MTSDSEIGFPSGGSNEQELLLSWQGFLRGAVVRKASGVSDEDSRWRPDGKLISLLGIVNHLTHVEWRWIDGGFRGALMDRADIEFTPGPDLTIAEALSTYSERAAATDAMVHATPLDQACSLGEGLTLRWVLLHLINETARHAGHADAVRELLDGVVGE